MSRSIASDKATIDPPPAVDNAFPSTIIDDRDSSRIDEPDYSRERQKPDFVTADDNNFDGA